MYLEQFGLSEKPFEQTPDSRFMYASEQHAYALASIRFSLAQRDPFVIITGEIGSGKTTLLNAVLAGLDKSVAVARISHTRLSDTELLQMILLEFGFTPFNRGKVELLSMLRNFVQEQAARRRQVAILIDEAQNLTADVLEELRLLTCIETEKEKLLNVVLLGQPQLATLLDSPALEQLRQRCRLRIHIDELTEEETGHYMRHRLAVAGGDYDVAFAPGVDKLVHQFSGGVPRLINILCDTALTACLVEEQPMVTPDVLEEVARELKWGERGHRAEPEPEPEPHPEPAETGRTRARLHVLHRGRPVGEFVLTDAQNLIGRDPACHVHLDSKFFSRRHAIVAREGDGWTIADLNSTNGTRVNGRPIRKHRLKDGDAIAIGKHQLVFVSDRAPASRTTEDAQRDPTDTDEFQVLGSPTDSRRVKGGHRR
jgi:type II secretory pathway predicted ATPase ExeA